MKVKVCFVALNAYPAIDSLVPGGFGGIETRSWMFAEALGEKLDFDVKFLVRHTDSLRNDRYGKVKMHCLVDPYHEIRTSLVSRLQRMKRFPWIALRQPRLADAYYLPLLTVRKLLKGRTDPLKPEPGLDDIEADALLTFGVQSHSASVIASAQKKGIPSILFLGSDSDLDENYLPGNNYVSAYRDRADVCYWVIQNADKILCQTEYQRERLKSLFQRDSELIKNPIDVEKWDRNFTSVNERNPQFLAEVERYAIWIGRADPVHKRPQDVIKIAGLCPEIPFLVIMNKRDDVLDAQVRADAPENVFFEEKVPFHSMPMVFRKASAMVNTSALEGFPNTFLQAAISRVPIVSLNVEEQFLIKANAGYFASESIENAAKQLRSIWNGTAPNYDGREYVIRHHSLNQQVDHLASAIKRVVASA